MAEGILLWIAGHLMAWVIYCGFNCGAPGCVECPVCEPVPICLNCADSVPPPGTGNGVPN